MEILFITHKFPPSVGGMEKQSYELINGITKKCKVHLIAQSPSEGKIWFFLRLRYRIKKMLERHPTISAIHCNDGLAAIFCSWLLKYTSIPITVTLHGLDIVHPNRLLQKYYVRRLRNFDHIFAVSQATAKECLKRGFLQDKLSIIKNGVDIELRDVPVDPGFPDLLKSKYGIDIKKYKIILSVGRAVRRKGFSWFAEKVAPRLADDVLYIIVGSWNSEAKLFELVFKLLPNAFSHQLRLLLGYPSDSNALRHILRSSNNKSIHLGKIPFDELIQMMSYADIMVMPNINVPGDMEGFGLTALEAAMRKTFVVASGIEGITSAIQDGKNGILLPSSKEKTWIKILKSLLADTEDLKYRGLNAYNFVVSNYSWDKMANEYYNKFCAISRYDKYSIRNIEIQAFSS